MANKPMPLSVAAGLYVIRRDDLIKMINPDSLKKACQLYAKSGGRIGLKSDRPERDWFVTEQALRTYFARRGYSLERWTDVTLIETGVGT